MNHKSLSLVICIAFAIAFHSMCYAQNVVNGVYQGSPRSFMYLPASPNPSGTGATDWVKPSYGSSYSNPSATMGIYGANTNNHSHAFIKRNANGTVPTDCNACYLIGGSNYGYLNTLPLSWNTPDFSDGQLHYEDTVIQIGCDQAQGRKSQQMEYKFVPDTNNPVLLVNYMLVMENKLSGHGYPGSSIVNPTITMEVVNANTDQLLNLGYYPTDYVQNGNNGTGGPNNNWPYARYKFIAPGSQTGDNSTVTPSAFNLPPIDCPQAHACNCSSDAPSVVSYDYVTVAYRLTEQAQTHTPVKLRIKVQACDASAHWATIYYTAKMVPGKMVVDACGDNDIVLSVPYGFNANSYEWYSGNDAATAIYDGNLNDLGSVYTKVLNRNTSNLKPYYRCIMESQTGVPFTYEAYLKIYDVKAICECQQIVDECHYTFTFGDSSRVATLTPNTAQGGYDTTRFTQWNRRWRIYDNEGTLLHTNNSDRTFTYRFPDDVSDSVLVWLEVSDPNGACGPDTMQYKVFLNPDFIQPVSSTDTIITCEEHLPVIFDQATFGDLYTWHDAGTRDVKYEGVRWNGCDSTVRVTLIVQKPLASVSQGDDFCDAFSTLLTAESNVDIMEYSWSTNENTPSITVTTPGTYTVTITDEGGCVATASVSIPACKPFINLPNTITPSDHNGLNDCVEVIQRNLVKSLEFSVFNRNGELVYSTTDKEFCWDGRDMKNNKLFVNVTYNYILKIIDYDGYATMYKGSITVL